MGANPPARRTATPSSHPFDVSFRPAVRPRNEPPGGGSTIRQAVRARRGQKQTNTDAHLLENAVLLCAPCHRRTERGEIPWYAPPDEHPDGIGEI
ncbi:hypothetical protein MBEHAL_0140 [Halarchaeum acidiphilum MH1-52-1]|uniref:HNH domain-containing protein n=1 Tax=Halarchaeum acidiphilum MH1-52-1 TaxID=1261545 RepID=U2YQY9_9EURY|nr:hypothetical protein MBEHAL_0140 [Halarchaeum acidiphilum MH1-52-1]